MKSFLFIGATLALLGAGCATSTPSLVTPDLSSSTNSTLPSPTVSSTTGLNSSSTKQTTSAPQPTTRNKGKTSGLQLQPSAPTIVKPGPATLYVTITDSAFQPQELAIHAGDSVVWTNKGATNHTSASDNAIVWDSGNIRPGSSYRRTFPYTGGYTYHDGAHPSITGTIIVR